MPDSYEIPDTRRCPKCANRDNIVVIAEGSDVDIARHTRLLKVINRNMKSKQKFTSLEELKV